MESTYKIILALHIISGFTALVTGLVPMIARKGGRQHNLWGNIYYWAMFGVFISTVMMFALRYSSLKLQFFLAVAVASFYLTFTGTRILKAKKTGHFPQRIDWIASYVTLAFGVACLGYMGWLFTEDNWFRGTLFGFFAGVCISQSWQDLRVFWGKQEIEKMHWLYHHLTRMVTSYGATATAFLVTMSRYFPQWTHLIVWILPGVLAGFGASRWKKKYQEKNREREESQSSRETQEVWTAEEVGVLI